jgi:putative ABC transport system permease protein
VMITQGRAMQPGRFELLVGEAAARLFQGMQLGDEISIKGARFKVVGHFVSGGRATESEAWLDVDVMANVFNRGTQLNTLLGRLASPESLTTLTAAIEADRRLANSVFRESDFFAAQSATSTRLMTLVGITVGIIMALGAVSTALNALYVAVATRTRKIAILRALGFSGVPIVISVLLESLLLALFGGVIGASLGWMLFDGFNMTSMGAAYAQVAFRFAVDPGLAGVGLLIALLIGFTGGLFPAIHAIRLKVVDGLRKGA